MVWIAAGATVVLVAIALFARWLVAHANQAFSQSLRSVASELAANSIRIDGLVRLGNENREQIQEVKNRIASDREQIQDVKNRTASLRSDFSYEQERLVETRTLVSEMQEHQEHGDTAAVLREVRHQSQLQDVETLLLLVTIHRSASTTLFDLLRSHPDVFFEPSAALWNDVGLDGRRYPLDLCNGPTAEMALEVQPGRGAIIPARFGEPRRPSIAIEKAHPQFFDFDSVKFAERLAKAERTSRYAIALVYGVRNPLDAMWSMYEYQQRNRRWYKFLSPESIPEFILRSIVAIEQLHHNRPAIVLDYVDVVSPTSRTRRLFYDLSSPPADPTLLDAAHESLAPGRRLAQQSGSFVGRMSEERSRLGPGGEWAGLESTIALAEETYHRLLASSVDA